MGVFKELTIEELNYKPTVQELIESILNAWDEDQLVMSIFGKGDLDVKFYDLEGELAMHVRFHLVGKYDKREKCGVHTFPEDADDLDFRIQNALDSCERDQFQDVYIHGSI